MYEEKPTTSDTRDAGPEEISEYEEAYPELHAYTITCWREVKQSHLFSTPNTQAAEVAKRLQADLGYTNARSAYGLKEVTAEEVLEVYQSHLNSLGVVVD